MTDQNPATPEPTAAPYGGEPAPAPAKSGGSKKIISIVGALVLIAIFGAFRFGLFDRFLNSSDPNYATVGECLTEAPDVNDVKIVDCGDATAKQTVLVILEDKTEAEAQEECAKNDKAEAYILLTTSKTITASTKGKILCLGPKA